MRLVTFLLISALALQSASTPIKPEVAQAVRGAALLRDAMRDPDSFAIEKVFMYAGKDKKGFEFQNTCYEYRARNGFGGMNRDAASYTEYKGKAKLTTSNLFGPKCVTKDKETSLYADITAEFQEAAKAEKEVRLKSSN
jgi:hypothetical protein